MKVMISASHVGQPAQRVLRIAYYVFLTAGIIALGYSGYALLDSYWYQRVEITNFEKLNVVAEPPVADAVAVAEGGLIGEIEVPRLGMKAIVVQGDTENLLRRAVGHLPQTAMPDQPGNVALAGHRDGLFRPLRNIQPGDFIKLRTAAREYQYEVQWTAIVSPSALRVIEPTSEPSLTLVTCFPFYYVGAAPERFIVRARKISVAARIVKDRE
jgi:sortase A